MPVSTWFIGPHLIGFLFIVLGVIQKRFPPKKINNYYGYRMPSAMKNQQTWDEANRYAGVIMIKTGMVIFIAGLIITILMHEINISARTMFLCNYLVILVSTMGSVLTLIVATENHLDKTFKDRQ